MEPLVADDPPKVGDYRLEGRLGLGGMGRVYLGRSPGGRPVAVKVVRPELAGDKGFRRRFAREVEAARAVNAFYTAPVIDADTEADPPWLVTAYVPGPSLRTAIEEDGPLPAEEITALGAGLAEGLLAIHREGIVHRDLTPGNVILAGDGPRIVDFGIARALDATSPATTTGVIGTVAFMSPEQAKGAETGPAGDVFSLACVLAYAATGRSPFGTGAPEAVLYRVVHADADLDGVPDELRDLLAACLAKDPADRPEAPALLRHLTGAGMPSGAGTPFAASTPSSGAMPSGAGMPPGAGKAREAGPTAAAGNGSAGPGGDDGTGLGGNAPDGTAVFEAGTTTRLAPPEATRIDPPEATRLQPPAPFTLARNVVAKRPGTWFLGAGAVLGLVLGALAFAVAGGLDELPLSNEDDEPGNVMIFLVGWPAAVAFLAMFIDPVSPAPARTRMAGLMFGFIVGASIWMTVAVTDGLDEALPAQLAAPGLAFPLIIGPATGLALAKRRIRDKYGEGAETRVRSWYAHRSGGAVIALVLGIGLVVFLDEEAALPRTDPDYSITIVLTLLSITVMGALAGVLLEPTSGHRLRAELTVDLDGLSTARPGGAPLASVAWRAVERVELVDGRVVAWFIDGPETAAWAERRGLRLHAMDDARPGEPPQAAYVVFDSGLHRSRPGEAGSLHRLDEALRAFGAGKYR